MCLNITRRVQFQIFGTSPLSEYRPCVQSVNALSNVLRSPNLLNSIRPSTAVTELPAIPASPFLNTDGPVDPHNDVIDERYANDFSRLLQSLCYADILIAGSRIAARMIVNSDNAVRRIPYRRAKYFSRMH